MPVTDAFTVHSRFAVAIVPTSTSVQLPPWMGFDVNETLTVALAGSSSVAFVATSAPVTVPASGSIVTSDGLFRFSVKLPEGNYKVTITLGDTQGTSCTTVKSEVRRLMLEGLSTNKGETLTATFGVNVRTPQLSKGNAIKLNSRELDYATGIVKTYTWDDKLTL